MAVNTTNNIKSIEDTVVAKIIVQNGVYGVLSDKQIHRAKSELQPCVNATAAIFGLKSEMRKAFGLNGSGGDNNDDESNGSAKTRSFTFKTSFIQLAKLMTYFETKMSDNPRFIEKKDSYERKRQELGLGSTKAEQRLIGEKKAEALKSLKSFSFRCTTVWIQINVPASSGENVIHSKSRHFLQGYSDDSVKKLLTDFGVEWDDVILSHKPKGHDEDDEEDDEEED